MRLWKNNIWIRTTLLFLTISITIFIVVFFVLFYFSQSMLEQEIQINASTKLELISDTIKSKMSSAYTAMYLYSFDSEIIFLSRDDLHNYFLKFNDISDSLDVVAVLDKDGIVYTSSDRWLYGLNVDINYYYSHSRTNRLLLAGPYYSKLLASRAICIIRQFVHESDGLVRLLVGEISASELFTDVNSGLTSDETLIVLGQDGSTLYIDSFSKLIEKVPTSNGPLDINDQMRMLLSDIDSGITTVSIKGRDFIVQCVYTYGMYIYILTDTALFNSNINSMRTIFIIIAIISTVIITFMSLVLSRLVLHPVRKIAADMDKMFSDDPSQIGPVERQDEIGSLLISFKLLLERLHDSHAANLRSEQARHLLEYKVLQSQIQPHFLLNVHICILSLIEAREYDRATAMLKSLDSLLRASINDREIVTLEEEIQFLMAYVNLQSIRYPNIPSVQILGWEEFSNVFVPKFLLQPFVENSIRHGLAGVNYLGEIIIEIQKNENNICIVITDNGRGITPHRLWELNHDCYTPENGIFSIGITNVRGRLHNLFGNNSDLIITSREGIGTRVELVIPLNGNLHIK